MGYVKQSTFFDGNEIILYVTRKHWVSIFWPFASCLLAFYSKYWIDGQISFFLILGSIIWIFRSLGDLVNNELGVTNRRILYSDDLKLPGLHLSAGLMYVPGLELKKVSNVTVNQSIFGKFFNCGTIKVNGINEPGQPIHFIKNPRLFKQKVNGAIRAYLNPPQKGNKLDTQDYPACTHCEYPIDPSDSHCKQCGSEVGLR